MHGYNLSSHAGAVAGRRKTGTHRAVVVVEMAAAAAPAAAAPEAAALAAAAPEADPPQEEEPPEEEPLEEGLSLAWVQVPAPRLGAPELVSTG